ncbi:MAG: MFS transporter [Deltaproteobacteria bacterium]|nr:MFS transporter [Deltaproteobacteria bacterium]
MELFWFTDICIVSVLMPFYLEQVHHFAPDKAGLFMTAIPLTIFIVAPISGRLSDRFGGQELSFIGAMVGAIGLFAMAGALGLGIFEESSPAAIVLALSSIGLATGLFQSPNNNAILSAVPNHKLGVASALLAMIRNLGFGTGTTLATGFFAWRQNVTGNFVQSLHFAFWAAGFFAVGAMFASLGRKRGIERGVERGHVMSDDSEQNIHMDHVVTPKKEGL